MPEKKKNMYKENLFDLIRKEEVIIWAGAGMSISAGYPSGDELTKIFLENLTPSEREVIGANILLPDLAEEFFRIKGNNRNRLVQILNKTYQKLANSTNTHDTLAMIPHFKTIITTNYDTLFENAYGSKAQVIFRTNHIPYIDSKTIQIFKVHGDLSDPDSIILTRSDYNKFFIDSNENKPFWTVIRERLATKAVLFLGYNLEDPNVSVIFDKITKSLGGNRKECFLVAPNLPAHKVTNLNKKGIHYLDYKAEDLITELFLQLKEHIVFDLEDDKTTAETFRGFLGNIKLLPTLKADNDRYKVAALEKVDGSMRVKGTVTFKIETEDSKRDYKDFIDGKKFGGIVFSKDDNLVDANLWLDGVKFMDLKKIKKVEIKSPPKIDTKIDLRFQDGFEYNEIPVKAFVSHSLAKIPLELENAYIDLKVNVEDLPKVKGQLNYKHKDICKNVYNEIKLFSLLQRIAEGQTFTIYSKQGKVMSHAFPRSDEFLKEIKAYLNYFNRLKKIENSFGIRFSNFLWGDINEASDKLVENICSIIENGYLIVNYDKVFSFGVLEDSIDEFISNIDNIDNPSTPIITQYVDEEIIELHSKKINLGFKKVVIEEPIILNLGDIKTKETNILRVTNKSKQVKIIYDKKYNSNDPGQ